MPGVVARTSTIALTNATLPYALSLSKKGLISACKSDFSLKKGLNIFRGNITCKGVADSLGYKYIDPNDLI